MILHAADREAIADWIESTILARSGPLGHDAIFALAAEELGAEEAQVGLALHVIDSRARLLGQAYPFQPEAVGIRLRTGAESLPYTLLLLVSPSGPARQLMIGSPSGPEAEAFERVVVEAMKGLLGPRSSALRFGWPSDEGRPQEFHLAIAWLAERLGITPGAGYRPPRRKDGGVDVVAWRPFPDGRSGFPVFLLQCTLQDKFIKKSMDVDVRIWSSWLTLDCDPQTVLAIPGTIGSPEVWKEVALRCLILDRLRLSGLLESVSLSSVDGCSDVVSDILNVLSSSLAGARS